MRAPTHGIAIEDEARQVFQVRGFRGGSPGGYRFKLFRSAILSPISEDQWEDGAVGGEGGGNTRNLMLKQSLGRRMKMDLNFR